jgi:hypothetical protein
MVEGKRVKAEGRHPKLRQLVFTFHLISLLTYFATAIFTFLFLIF